MNSDGRPERDRGQWNQACLSGELAVGERRLLRLDSRQVLLFHLENDRWLAVDNRCPHEGYPLVQGQRDGCTLTCAWHNFKFDLRDGRCLKGDEDLRSYPTRIIEGRVEIDLADPDPTEQIARIEHSLEQALCAGRLAQAVRETARLLQVGAKPQEILSLAVTFDARYAEYGSTHVLAVAADLREVLERSDDHEEQLVALVHLLDLVAEADQRRPEQPLPRIIAPPADFEAALAELREAVEAEDGDRARGLVRGGLRGGWTAATLIDALLLVCSDHLLDFGHPLIYASKLRSLAPHLAPAQLERVADALVLRIVNATREDLLPPMSELRERVDRWSQRITGWQVEGGAALSSDEHEWIVDSALGGSRDTDYDRLASLLDDHREVRGILDALSEAAARRLLRFDPRHDQDSGVQEGWLDLSHAFTTVNAVRNATAQSTRPLILRAIFFAYQFIRRTRRCDLPRSESSQTRPMEGDVPALVGAVFAQRSEEAIAIGHHLLDSAQPLEPLRAGLERCALRGSAVRPIFTAHRLKMVHAAFQEHGSMIERRPVAARVVLLALLRFLASPVRERDPVRMAHEAVGLVEHGRLPRRLSV